MKRSDQGRDVVQRVFGGALYQQGRGFYSALELFAIIRGEVLLKQHEERFDAFEVRVLPESGPARYLRPGHDHARRLLVADEDVVPGVFAGPDTREAVRALLRGIEAPVAGRRTAPDKWQRRHFYPYPAEAVHYDAVERKNRKPPVSVERYQFRGAGGLAHKILRTDPDKARLAATRSMFEHLLSDTGSAVGKVLASLARHDAIAAWGKSEPCSAEELLAAAFDDPVEARSLWGAGGEGSTAHGRTPTRWMDLLREGVNRILRRAELSDFDRVDGLMHWVPWCIAQHQLAMARRTIGEDEDAPIVFDAGHRASRVRTMARRDLGDATLAIKNALFAGAEAAGVPELTRGSAAWWKGPRTFYPTTAFAVGALNAHTGRRHFEMRAEFLEAVVHALVEEPMTLRRFSSDVLGDRLRIVCDRWSGDRFPDVELDRRDLEKNGAHLASRLDEVGLLRAFSDSTLMVGVEA